MAVTVGAVAMLIGLVYTPGWFCAGGCANGAVVVANGGRFCAWRLDKAVRTCLSSARSSAIVERYSAVPTESV